MLINSKLVTEAFPGGSVVKNAPPVQETWARSLGWADPLEEAEPHSHILEGESHGQRSLVGYSPRGHKESDKTATKQEVNGV